MSNCIGCDDGADKNAAAMQVLEDAGVEVGGYDDILVVAEAAATRIRSLEDDINTVYALLKGLES